MQKKRCREDVLGVHRQKRSWFYLQRRHDIPCPLKLATERCSPCSCRRCSSLSTASTAQTRAARNPIGLTGTTSQFQKERTVNESGTRWGREGERRERERGERERVRGGQKWVSATYSSFGTRRARRWWLVEQCGWITKSCQTHSHTDAPIEHRSPAAAAWTEFTFNKSFCQTVTFLSS